MDPPSKIYKNRILGALPISELSRLERYLEPVNLKQEETLSDGRADHGYFLEEGMASAVVGFENGNTIEAVLMLYYDRATVCVSSQVGCAMGCSFCATGQMGFTRNLTTGEILEQVIQFNRWLHEHPYVPKLPGEQHPRYVGAQMRKGKPPLPILLGVTVPLLAFFVAYFGWAAFRAFVLAADLRLGAAIQAWRVGGLGFIALYVYGILPGEFALPAGLGDIAIGVTAPWIVIALIRRPGFASSPLFVTWNVLGILDLIVAVAANCAPGPFRRRDLLRPAMAAMKP